MFTSVLNSVDNVDPILQKQMEILAVFMTVSTTLIFLFWYKFYVVWKENTTDGGRNPGLTVAEVKKYLHGEDKKKLSFWSF